MKHALLWLLVVAVVALGIAGVMYLDTATGYDVRIPDNARTPALVSGIFCLSIGTGLLVLGIFVFRKRD